jgi:hypothetical protein
LSRRSSFLPLLLFQIKDQLLLEKKKMEASSNRRKQQTLKKFAKQVQAERLKEKTKDKREAMDQLNLLKKRSSLSLQLLSSPSFSPPSF